MEQLLPFLLRSRELATIRTTPHMCCCGTPSCAAGEMVARWTYGCGQKTLHSLHDCCWAYTQNSQYLTPPIP